MSPEGRNRMNAQCSRCGESFDNPANHKYCSKECAKQAELERKRVNNRRWQKRNGDYWREWRAANPGKRNEYDRRYYNPDVYRMKHRNDYARRKNAGGTYTDQQFTDLCEHFNWRCVCCGQEAPLTADHVIPVSKGGTNDIENIQPLCRSCNSAKHTQTIDYRIEPKGARTP